jgi:hypothetical protein
MTKKTKIFIASFAMSLGIMIAGETGAASATVSMALDHNRMTVAVEMLKPDGTWKSARAWVDSGGTAVMVAESLARDLGVDLSALPAGGRQTMATKVPVPALRLGGVLLDVEGLTLSVRPGRFAMPGIQAECVLPPRCLRRLHVVFDYPARKLTVARPGVLAPRGTAVPCRVHPETGLFMVGTTIEGEKVALGVDTGSAGTWVSDTLTAAWLARHSGWPHAVGATGSTNFFGFPFETQGVLLSLPGMTIGVLAIAREIAVLGLDRGIFDWYSQKSAVPVSGFIGADLIARFRLEVDFPGQMTWWRPGPNRPAPTGPPSASRDLDIVGLTLRPENDGSFTVAGVVTRAGRPLVAGVHPGDRLLRVGSLEVTGAPMGQVIDALRGKPGDVRLLLLEREGKQLTVRAPIVRLP